MLPTVPQSLEKLALKATAKEPLDRYSSCYEMLEDLQTCLNPERLQSQCLNRLLSVKNKGVATYYDRANPRKVPATSK